MRDLVALAVPAVVLTTKRAWAMTEAAYARGFDSPHRRPYRQLAMGWLDWLLLAGAVAVAAILVLVEVTMSQRARILIAVGVLVALVAAVLGVEALRALVRASRRWRRAASPFTWTASWSGGFVPDDLAALEQVSFVDAEEGKTQEGWLLRDVLLLHVKASKLEPETRIVVTSSSRDKVGGADLGRGGRSGQLGDVRPVGPGHAQAGVGAGAAGRPRRVGAGRGQDRNRQ